MVRRFTAWMILGLVPAVALAAVDEAGEQALQRVEHFARSYDLNKSEKYHIDFFYSPVHAMAAYRELLLWSAQPDVPKVLGDELLATITAGMVAVIRDSGAGPTTDNAPLGIGFVRALPRYGQEPDPARPETLRWLTKELDPRTTPAAVGRSLSAKSLLLSRLSPDMPEHALVLDSLRREYDALAAQWLKKAPRGYMPETALWEKGAWQVGDERSRLSSQANLLTGLVETEAALAGLGSGTKAWRARLQRQIGEVLAGLVQRHYDSAAHSFVDVYDPEKGRGDRIMLEEMAQLMEALSLVLQHQPPESSAWKQAKQVGREQVQFLLRVGKWQEALPRGYLVAKGTPLHATVRSLEEPLAVLTILQQARPFDVTDTDEALQQVKASLEADYWSADAGIYRSAAGFTASAYDGHLFGLALGFFRRDDGAEAQQRAEGLIRVVLKEAGLLQCEPAQSGEPLSLAQALAQRGADFAGEMASLAEAEKVKRNAAFVREIADQDDDTVPGCRFAARAFGGAPVPVIQTSVRTPYPQPKKELSKAEGSES